MFSIDCFMMEMVETFTPVYSIHSCLQTLDNGVNVVQLETAVGAAIKSFEGAIGEFYSPTPIKLHKISMWMLLTLLLFFFLCD